MHLSNTKSKEPKINKKPIKLTAVFSDTFFLWQGTGRQETLTIILQSSPTCDKTGSVLWENVGCFRKTDTVHITRELNSRGKFHNSHIIFMIKDKVAVFFMNDNSSDEFFLFWRSQQNSKAGSPPPRISCSVKYLRLCHSHTKQDPERSSALHLSIKMQCGQVCPTGQRRAKLHYLSDTDISGSRKVIAPKSPKACRIRKVLMTYPLKQWAAVTSHLLLITDAPQRWVPSSWILACHGHSPSRARCPPIILSTPVKENVCLRIPQPVKEKAAPL